MLHVERAYKYFERVSFLKLRFSNNLPQDFSKLAQSYYRTLGNYYESF